MRKGAGARSTMSPCLLLLLCCLHASSAFVVPPANSRSRHHEVVVEAERGQSRGEAVFQVHRPNRLLPHWKFEFPCPEA